MQLTLQRLVIQVGTERSSHPLGERGELDDLGSAVVITEGPVDVTVSSHRSAPANVHGHALERAPLAPQRLAWSCANPQPADVRVRSVSLVYRVTDVVGELRMFCNGYQSWSPTGVATFGIDEDRSCKAHFEMLQGVYAADARDAEPGELRSEWVTVLEDGSGDGPLVLGFDEGTTHDGTFRLRRVRGGPDGGGAEGDGAEDVAAELWVEAFLGDVVLHAGAHRVFHDVSIMGGDGSPVEDLLGRWATGSARRSGARASAPYQVGWCSWYHYFHDVTEEHIRSNVRHAVDGGWPFHVFQLDDGFQSAIGDWLTTNDKFPSGLASVADAITGAGFAAGLWIAPFLVAPDSVVATTHPEWLAQTVGDDGELTPLFCWWNPPWGGGRDGLMYGLDTTHPQVLDHLAATAEALVALGFTYLKLDFTFAPSLDGVWHDPTRTPAERVRSGYAAIRQGAGPDAFILGCGVPLANVVGIVDGNRIGQDVAPLWALDPAAELVAGFQGVEPSTQNAFGNTLARSFMHRRFWLNDPDCLMLRSSDTNLSEEEARTWARTVGLSGGMALVSDDLSLLGDDARALLDDVIALGRASDVASAAGTHPTVPDLMAHRIPTMISAAWRSLVVDTATGAGSYR